jgi:hypothetical protein
MTDGGWTVPEASAQFSQTGLPIDERNLRAIVRNLPGFHRIGEKKSGKRGGRGEALYAIGDFQLLHKDLSRWLTPPGGQS